MHEKKTSEVRDTFEPEGGNGREIAHSRFCNEVNEQIFKGIGSNDIFGAATLRYFTDRTEGDGHRVIGEVPDDVSPSRDQ